ncbi:hypothetical protein L7F22_027447 [Adiantum nelumboides]|nr:hypothetical protein [Adiantum nelumboides]
MASPPNALYISSDYSSYDDSSSIDQPNTPLSAKLLVAAIIIIFCCAFFIVSLHIFGKWLWRSRNRQQGDFQAHAPITMRNAGLSKAAIASLPTFIYTEAADIIDDTSRSAGSLECVVCLSKFQQDEKGRMLPSCKHCFHIECIDMWFYSHSTCPLCRAMHRSLEECLEVASLVAHPGPSHYEGLIRLVSAHILVLSDISLRLSVPLLWDSTGILPDDRASASLPPWDIASLA